MCFTAVSTYGLPKIPTYGWKVMQKAKGNTWIPPVYGSKRQIALNQWSATAKSSPYLLSATGKQYRRGYHVFATREGARTYKHRYFPHDFPHDDAYVYKVFRVAVRDVRSFGIQHYHTTFTCGSYKLLKQVR